MAYKPHKLDPYILELLRTQGEMRSKDIYTSMPEEERTLKRRLGVLKKENKVSVRDRFYYSLPADASTSTQTQSPDDKLEQISKQLRTAGDNEVTISELLNEYDDLFKEWGTDKGIDFDKRLERFYRLTAIADRLMKRWALVHVGYDTNTRQAQEDAKAKTEERQKAALKDAPLEETIMVVGKYDPKAMALIDCIPSSVENTDDLENMTDEEKEKTAV